MMAKQTHGAFGTRMNRRSAMAAVAGAAALPLVGRAQEGADEAGDAEELAIAEAPSYGVRRPGPVQLLAAPLDKAVPQAKALVPVQMVVPNAAVDAPVEIGTITPDGIMENPSGSFVVAWYEAISSPGLETNVVMAGHLDYFGVPQAVFYYLPQLPVGDTVSVVMEDGTQYDYEIESSRLYDVATELTPEVIQTDVVGDTGYEALTLITCGGPLNETQTEYLSRWVIRAAKV
jgi:hypothetical protein